VPLTNRKPGSITNFSFAKIRGVIFSAVSELFRKYKFKIIDFLLPGSAK
jgi:hypothetical protein